MSWVIKNSWNLNSMKLKGLTPLKSVGRLSTIQKLTKESLTKSKYLSQIDMILYSTNLCYYSSRIIRNEIKVKNSDEVLSNVTKEIMRIYNILRQDDYYTVENILTKKQHKENFKKFGITKKKLEH